MFVVRKQLIQQQLINKIHKKNRASNYDMHMKWKEAAQS